MMQWHQYAAVALAVGLFATLPASAQPGPRGGSGKDASVKEIEAQLTKLRDHMKTLEAKLASAKQKGNAKSADKGRLAKGEKAKHDAKGRPGFGRRPGSRGLQHGHRRGHWGRGGRGPTHGFGHRHGPRGPVHGFGHSRGPWHGRLGHSRGKGEAAQAPRGKPAPKGAPELKGTIRPKEAPKSGGASGLEKKLDLLQKALDEIRGELKRR